MHVQQDFLRDDRGQEAVERLLRAAVGIIDQVGQGVDHRAGQRGRIADLEPRLLRAAASSGTLDVELARGVLGPDDAGPRFHLQHAVDVAGELLLHGVRLFVGEGLHADRRLALVEHLDAPIHAGLALRGDRDRLRSDSSQRLRASCRPAPSPPGPLFFVFK